MGVVMQTQSKVDLAKQIGDYLGVWTLSDNDSLRFYRDLRRLSRDSLETLVSLLQRMYT
jgi:hypothetical protein